MSYVDNSSSSRGLRSLNRVSRASDTSPIIIAENFGNDENLAPSRKKFQGIEQIEFEEEFEKKEDSKKSLLSNRFNLSSRTRYIIASIFLFSILKLIFMDGGIYSFYTNKKTLSGIEQINQEIIAENDRLAIEIEKLQNDSNYKRQAIRDYLGMIEPDEYLVIFKNEK